VVDGPVCIGNWCPHNYSGGYGGSMTLIEAIKRSINTIAVKLSISIGKGNAKVGRAAIVKNAKAMGLRTPLPDTPSLPIGADEVTVLDHTVAFATFPNLGKSVTSHAILRSAPGPAMWSGASIATARSRARCCRKGSPWTWSS
jgi:penicillin-binding protein 1A